MRVPTARLGIGIGCGVLVIALLFATLPFALAIAIALPAFLLSAVLAERAFCRYAKSRNPSR